MKVGLLYVIFHSFIQPRTVYDTETQTIESLDENIEIIRENKMKIDAFEFFLKDGRTALIRAPMEEDVPNILEFLYQTSRETDYLPCYPEECSKYTYKGEMQLIRNVNEAKNQAMLLCTVDGKIAGNSQIVWNTGIKTQHRANVAIALLQEFWNLGIGTRMFQELLFIAQKTPNILQVELDFIEGNTRARALYEKMGFRITGVKPNAFRLRDGTFLNEYSMVKMIDRHKMEQQ